MLTEQAKQLIPKARIVSFASWENTYPTSTIAKFQVADDQGRYPTDDDLQQLSLTLSTQSEPEKTTALQQITIARLLRDQAEEIVTEAREQVLAKYPGITDPGGNLYPAERATACWRDFWHFLRCVTYGIAGSQTQFTSNEGLHYMEQLYQELQVPLPAMVSGLEALKVASLKRLETGNSETVAPYFDHLIAQLRRFSKS